MVGVDVAVAVEWAVGGAGEGRGGHVVVARHHVGGGPHPDGGGATMVM